MLSQQVGFTSSWHMLTRDKGWIKPVLILALVGWVPIVGPMAILGFGFEWARLTAWGIDAAPKQRGVDVGKVLGTGARAFAVYLTLGIAASLVCGVLTAGAVSFTFTPLSVGLRTWFLDFDMNLRGIGLLGAAVGLMLGTFIHMAMMRATLYDSFGAGWRLDRLCQMVGRDFGGFLRVCVVSLASTAIVVACGAALAIIGGIFIAGGALGVVFSGGYSYDSWGHDGMGYLLHQLFSLGPSFMLVAVLLMILAVFACAVVTVSMELVNINACGQWFSRFSVDRWGLSSDPLPDGAPTVTGFSPQGEPTHAAASGGPAAPSDIPAQPGATAAEAPRADAPSVAGAAPSDWSPAAYAASASASEYSSGGSLATPRTPDKPSDAAAGFASPSSSESGVAPTAMLPQQSSVDGSEKGEDDEAFGPIASTDREGGGPISEG